MSTDVALPSQFKDVIRERILSTFLDLIPKDEIDKLVEKEIKAFFETEAILTVNQTQIEIANPQYDPKRNSGYNNEKTIKSDAIAFGSKMTPFRQLVWTTLHTELAPKLKAMISEDTSTFKTELDAWMVEQARPQLNNTNKALFTHLALGMSAMLLRNTMSEAISASHMNLRMALQNAGCNTSNMPAPFFPSEPN